MRVDLLLNCVEFSIGLVNLDVVLIKPSVEHVYSLLSVGSVRGLRRFQLACLLHKLIEDGILVGFAWLLIDFKPFRDWKQNLNQLLDILLVLLGLLVEA